MDELLFSEQLRACQSLPEPVSYLEILNYTDPAMNSSDSSYLDEGQFNNFVARKGPFLPRTLDPDTGFTNGIRLVLQQQLQDPKAFSQDVISLSAEAYESLVREMHLPLRAIETTSAVGPLFWWAYDEDPDDPHLHIIFRKSDVKWNGTSRGWEMTLSHSFRRRLTSGYVRAMDSADLATVLARLAACARPAAHPLLLPVLVLARELGGAHDRTQRDAREELRQLEKTLSRRYHRPTAASGERDRYLDAINRLLADCQCRVLWKRPAAWRGAVERAAAAAACFWREVDGAAAAAAAGSEDGGAGGDGGADAAISLLRPLHASLLRRLDFLAVKLEGLESYAHVSLERLGIQREVLNSIIDLRESRLSLEIAAQQTYLADASKRDSTSMKTLTLLGAIFLPGTFLSSIFSMSFFDFGHDMNGPVSSRLWIYFVVAVPLTAVIVGSWWLLDRRSDEEVAEDEMEHEARINRVEARIMAGIRTRTGAKVTSWAIAPAAPTVPVTGEGMANQPSQNTTA